MPNWLVSDIAITAGVLLWLVAWISLLEKRIQDLSDRQEELWQRHIKYEEMVAARRIKYEEMVARHMKSHPKK